MVWHAPSFVRCSTTSWPVEVSWYFRYPGLPCGEMRRRDGSVREYTHDANEEPVVWQELEAGGLDVRLELVQLYTVTVVYEDIFTLRDGEV